MPIARPLAETNAIYRFIKAVEAMEPDPPACPLYEDACCAYGTAYPAQLLMTWDRQLTLAWKSGLVTVDELAWEHLRLIEEDVAAGIVPWDAADFSELHNYVDANEYTITVQGCDMTDDGSELGNLVQTRVAVLMFGDRGRLHGRHILSYEAMPGVDWELRWLRQRDYALDLGEYLFEMGDH